MSSTRERTDGERATYAQHVEEAFRRWIDEGNARGRNPRLMRPLVAKASEGRTLTLSEIMRAANCSIEQATTLSSWLEALAPAQGSQPSAEPRTTGGAVREQTDASPAQDNRVAPESTPMDDQSPAAADSIRALRLNRESFTTTTPRTAQTAHAATPQSIAVSVGGGGVRLTWPSFPVADDETVVYRVVSRPGALGFKPEDAAHLAAVGRTDFVDDRSQESGSILGYQVWVYRGRSPQAASRSQPLLWAQQKVVQPLQRVSVAAGEGTLTVVGRWAPLVDPHAIVRVHRVPIHEAEYEDWDQAQYRISESERNVGGFVDYDGQAGQKFRYYLVVETVSDNVGLLSPVVEHDAEFVDRIRQVSDLRIEPRATEQGRRLEISWTPPSVGQVEIYWAQHQPMMGIDNHAHHVEVLPQLNVGEPVGYPVSDSRDGRAIIGAVPWPHGWTSVHVTAITRLGDQIYPSAPVSLLTDLVEIPAARLYQRVSHQNITLVWPERHEGSAHGFLFDWVKVYGCSPDTQPEEINEHTASLMRITHDVYKKEGGVRIALGADPKRVILVPGSTQGGKEVWGQPYILEYPGLRTVSYTVGKPTQLLGKMRPVTVKFRSSEHFENPPAFVLVHHPERLPRPSRMVISTRWR